MRIYVSVDAPHTWARVTRQGKLKGQGVAESLETVPVKSRADEVYAVIPGELFVSTEVSVPTRSRSKMQQALPFVLEDRLTEEVDSYHFVVLEWKPGKAVVTGFLSKEHVADWCNRFKQAGVQLYGMVADYQLLPIHPQATVTIAEQTEGRVSVLKSNGTGATLDGNTIGIWWDSLQGENIPAAVNSHNLAQTLLRQGGGNVKEWSIGEDFPAWFRNGTAVTKTPNILLQTETGKEHGKSIPGLRIALIFLAIAAIAKLGIDGYEYVLLEGENKRITREITNLFKTTFPDEKRIVNARAQLQQKLKTLQRGETSGSGFQGLLAVVAQAIKSSRSTIEEISFRDSVMEVLCSVKNFAELDGLQQHLAKAGNVDVELISSGSLGNRVSGRFRVSQKGADR